MKKKNLMSFNHSIKIILLSLVIGVTSFAQPTLQDKNLTKVNEMTDKLVKKLLLTDKQETGIKSILLDYFNGIQINTGDGSKTESLRQEAEAKIVNLLDDKQKMKFSIIKTEWWNQAN